jgi:hypothetical protein
MCGTVKAVADEGLVYAPVRGRIVRQAHLPLLVSVWVGLPRCQQASMRWARWSPSGSPIVAGVIRVEQWPVTQHPSPPAPDGYAATASTAAPSTPCTPSRSAACATTTEHAPTRRISEGLSKQEILRCLKRYIIRDVYTALRADLTALAP